MNILNFHICGKMAHFRRYYSNSSALSYSIPPRTTLIGMIAGLLGYERDSYYDTFAPTYCRIAVGIRGPQKKKMHTLSLLMIKSPNDLNAFQQHHSQTPTEIITPTHIRDGSLDYEIWFYHQDNGIMDQLKSQLHEPYGYMTQGISLALGTAQHLGWTKGGDMIEGESVSLVKNDIHSVMPAPIVNGLDFSEQLYELHLQKEDLPVYFHRDRIIARKENFIINAAATPVRASVQQAIELSDGRIITWMEDEADVGS